MSIPISCPGCQTPINAPISAAGKVASCPKCGQLLRVPVPTASLLPPIVAGRGDRPRQRREIQALPPDVEECDELDEVDVRRPATAQATLGSFSIVLGLGALATAAYPAASCASWIVAVAGLVTGLAGLAEAIQRRRDVKLPIIGAALSGFSLLLGVATYLVFFREMR